MSETIALDDPRSATPLFDAHGRRSVHGLDHAAHGKTRRRFLCRQPAIDYPAIHARITRHLNCPDAISVAAFQERAEGILAELRHDPRTDGVLGAVSVPFFLPRVTDILTRDIGVDLEELYIPAVQRSFEATFPTSQMVNHDKAGLGGKLSVAAGSRHETLLRRMAGAAVVGTLFVSLSEYSCPAAIEQMAGLPERFLLAGGFDLCAALIGSPDLLLRADGYPPLLWLAGLQAAPGVGYHFEAYGYNLTFNRRMHFDQAAEYWASALVVLEEAT